MKKIGVFVFTLFLLIVVSACGNNESASAENDSAAVVNPVEEVTAEELAAETGLSFVVPADAEDVVYSIINEESMIAQVDFVWNGVNCNCRAQSAGIPESDTIPDISGMYYQWEAMETGEIFYSEAYFQYNKGKEGTVGWYDFAPGILYSVSVDSNATVEFLKNLAEMTCPSVQGDASGDAVETESSADAPEIEGADLEEIVE